MKALTPIIRNMPALQIMEVASLVLGHSIRMKEIKNQYKLAKNEMNNQYKLQKQALDHDLVKFKKMSKLQSKQFNHGHKERIKMLQITKELAIGISNAPDIEMQTELREVLQFVLIECSKSRESIGFLQYDNTQYLLEGDR